ncbi:MAG: hypothetical protein NTV06_07580 [candidate division Zixibacteria bacterium]|nr:hypothetical protein [candidate division Zixibacteria bacterium]
MLDEGGRSHKSAEADSQDLPQLNYGTFSTLPAGAIDSTALRIDSVEIDNRNIFNTDSARYNYWIFRMANKLHLRTKRFIIARELLLRRGDIFSRQLADETERNLRSLPFLWDADIEFSRTDSSINIMKVTTSDRWTLFGGPSVSRTAGQTMVEIRGEELNLLGYGQYVSFGYFLRESEDNYLELSFMERRLLGTRYRLSLDYNDNPEVGLKSISLEKPFYSLDSRFSYNAQFTDIRREDLYYSGGRKVGHNHTDGNRFESGFMMRFGSYDSKITTGIGYLLSRTKVSGEVGTGISFPEDSSYYSIGPQLGFSHIKYIKTTRINGFERREDVPIINGSNVGIGWAWGEGGKKLYNTLSMGFNLAGRFGSNLIFLDAYRSFRYDEHYTLRRQSAFSLRYFNNHLLWMTPALFALYSEDRRGDGSNSLYLGENNGIRGYPRNYAEGERILRLNLENRCFTKIRILSADLGAVQFLDLAQNRHRGQNFNLGNMLWAIGVGLRLGTERISNAEVLRIDMAYAGQLKSWQISFGLGQYLK